MQLSELELLVQKTFENCSAEIAEQLFSTIKRHVNLQPLKAYCSNCGKSIMVHERKVDNENDLVIEVSPHQCNKKFFK